MLPLPYHAEISLPHNLMAIKKAPGFRGTTVSGESFAFPASISMVLVREDWVTHRFLAPTVIVKGSFLFNSTACLERKRY